MNIPLSTQGRNGVVMVAWLFLSFTLLFQSQSAFGEIDLDDDITSQCTSFTTEATEAQRNAIEGMLAGRDHRLWHNFFHGVRSAWLGLTADQQNLLANIHPTLVPPHPVTNANTIDAEDFLYFHHQMVLMVRRMLVEAGQPCIASWGTIPKPSDTAWPMPPLWTGADGIVAFAKSSAGSFNMVGMENTEFHNDSWLRQQKLLGDMGQVMSDSLHRLFHARFSAEPNPSVRPLLNISQAPDEVFNDKSYNNLRDGYATTVNPYFWKLHGYVDDVIFRWLKVRGYTKIAVQCPLTSSGKPDPKCYQWRGTWVGPDPEVVCDCPENEDDPDHVHVDILDKFFQYKIDHPETKDSLDLLLKTIDAAAGNPSTN